MRQEGEALVAEVEGMRRRAVPVHREGDQRCGQRWKRALSGVPRRDGLAGRGRLQFPATGQYRRGRAPRTPAPRAPAPARRPAPGRMAFALAGSGRRACRRGAPAFFASALVSPVLTAHPTEVQRKSRIAREAEIARMFGSVTFRAPDEAEVEKRRCGRRFSRCGRRRSCAASARVVDEISNGLAYYDTTFLRESSEVYAEIEDQLGTTDRRGQSRAGAESATGSAAIAMAIPTSPPGPARGGAPAKPAAALLFYLAELQRARRRTLSRGYGASAVTERAVAFAEPTGPRRPSAAKEEPYRRAIDRD